VVLTVENIYNAEGYRIGKKVNGTLTTYVYEYDKVVLELDGGGNAQPKRIWIEPADAYCRQR